MRFDSSWVFSFEAAACERSGTRASSPLVGTDGHTFSADFRSPPNSVSGLEREPPVLVLCRTLSVDRVSGVPSFVGRLDVAPYQVLDMASRFLACHIA